MSGNCTDMTGSRAQGFTLIELIVIMVILGILAAVAMPRMNSVGAFRSAEFHDQVIAALRYAQKTATSHRRLVCVTLGAGSVTLAIDSSAPKDTVCDVPLPIPGTTAAQVVTAKDGFTNAVPADLFFQPDGRMTSDAAGLATTDFVNAVDGGAIVVRGATGYVGT